MAPKANRDVIDLCNDSDDEPLPEKGTVRQNRQALSNGMPSVKAASPPKTSTSRTSWSGANEQTDVSSLPDRNKSGRMESKDKKLQTINGATTLSDRASPALSRASKISSSRKDNLDWTTALINKSASRKHGTKPDSPQTASLGTASISEHNNDSDQLPDSRSTVRPRSHHPPSSTPSRGGFLLNGGTRSLTHKTDASFKRPRESDRRSSQEILASKRRKLGRPESTDMSSLLKGASSQNLQNPNAKSSRPTYGSVTSRESTLVDLTTTPRSIPKCRSDEPIELSDDEDAPDPPAKPVHKPSSKPVGPLKAANPTRKHHESQARIHSPKTSEEFIQSQRERKDQDGSASSSFQDDPKEGPQPILATPKSKGGMPVPPTPTDGDVTDPYLEDFIDRTISDNGAANAAARELFGSSMVQDGLESLRRPLLSRNSRVPTPAGSRKPSLPPTSAANNDSTSRDSLRDGVDLHEPCKAQRSSGPPKVGTSATQTDEVGSTHTSPNTRHSADEDQGYASMRSSNDLGTREATLPQASVQPSTEQHSKGRSVANNISLPPSLTERPWSTQGDSSTKRREEQAAADAQLNREAELAGAHQFETGSDATNTAQHLQHSAKDLKPSAASRLQKPHENPEKPSHPRPEADRGSSSTDHQETPFEVQLRMAEDSERTCGVGSSLVKSPKSKTNTMTSNEALASLPLSNQVELTMGKYLEELRGDNEYWTGTWLKRARCSVAMRAEVAKDNARSNSPAKRYSFASFKSVQASTSVQKTGFTTTAGVFLVEKQSPSGAKYTKTSFITPITRFETHDTMPSYAHYVKIKHNLVAPNVKSMHCLPYFGDEFDLSKAEGLKEHYYLDIRERIRKLERLLHAQAYDSYVESALHDLGLRWSDVLRVMLELTPNVGQNTDAQKALRRRSELLDEDFDRSTKRSSLVLSSLPESAPEKLAKAVTLCENFKRLTKCTLWQVARRHQLDFNPAKESEHLHSLLDEMTCRICLRFCCPYHGELLETGDADSESEHSASSAENSAVNMDIVHPEDINVRSRIDFPPSIEVRFKSRPLDLADVRRQWRHWHSWDLVHKSDEREPFYPCHHPGSSCEDADCSCYENRVMCEKSCTCENNCARKFQGCSCKIQRKGQKLVCFEDERCVCWQFGRECDPELCLECNVEEVLDPANREKEKTTVGRCNNATIQRGISKHTLLGDSGIHGFGLYAGENIKAHEFVGEYKGEVITKEEAERRGAVYEHQKLSYLFSLNAAQEIDSTYFGNKVRFINHASARTGGNANVYPRIIMVNNVHRIALYGSRNIGKGEELFFDYGPYFPDEQLGGKKPKKSAPHVRNANLVRDEFYDVETAIDERGNRRARKGARRGRPPKKGEAGGNAVAAKERGGVHPGAGRKRQTLEEPAINGDENGEETDVHASSSAGKRLAEYNISEDNDLTADGMDMDAEVGAEEDDVFQPEESEESDDSENKDNGSAATERLSAFARGIRARKRLLHLRRLKGDSS